MDFKTRYLDDFETDLNKAIDWYEAISPKNAIGFVEDVEQTIDSLSKNPLLFQKVNGRIRKANLKIYPYKIIFQIVKKELLVIAIAHHKQHPKFWRKRLRK